MINKLKGVMRSPLFVGGSRSWKCNVRMLPASLYCALMLFGFMKVSHQFHVSCDASLGTVRPVGSCPVDEVSYKEAAEQMKCFKIQNDCPNFQYHCILNDFLNGTVEVCAPSLLVTDRVCAKFDSKVKSILRIAGISNGCEKSCPFRYNSTTMYNYPECYNLGRIAKIIADLPKLSKSTTSSPKTSRSTPKISTTFIFTNATQNTSDTKNDHDVQKKSPIGVIIGPVIGFIVPVLVISAAVIGVYCRRRNPQNCIRDTNTDKNQKAFEGKDKSSKKTTVKFQATERSKGSGNGKEDEIEGLLSEISIQDIPEKEKRKADEISSTSVSNSAVFNFDMGGRQGDQGEKVNDRVHVKLKGPKALAPRNTKISAGSKPNYQDYKYDDRKARKSPTSLNERIDELEQKFDLKLSEESRERKKLDLRIRALEQNIEKVKSEKEYLIQKIKELEIDNRDKDKRVEELEINNRDKDKRVEELQKKLEEKDQEIVILQQKLHKLQKETELGSDRDTALCRRRLRSC